MTELSFLIELLLNHELKKETKDLIASRIKEVESNLVIAPRGSNQWMAQPAQIVGAIVQAPSTMAAIARHEGLAPNIVAAPNPNPPIPLTGNEMQARENSMEILKKRKQQHLKA